MLSVLICDKCNKAISVYDTDKICPECRQPIDRVKSFGL